MPSVATACRRFRYICGTEAPLISPSRLQKKRRAAPAPRNGCGHAIAAKAVNCAWSGSPAPRMCWPWSTPKSGRCEQRRKESTAQDGRFKITSPSYAIFIHTCKGTMVRDETERRMGTGTQGQNHCVWRSENPKGKAPPDYKSGPCGSAPWLDNPRHMLADRPSAQPPERPLHLSDSRPHPTQTQTQT